MIPAGVAAIGERAFVHCSELDEVTFKGSAPEIGSGLFKNVAETVYYPAQDSTWTEEVMRQYGGNITWMPYGAEDSMPGDINGSGTVNADDAIYQLNHALFGDAMYPVTRDCDFDSSGTVNADDAIYLLYYTLFGNTLYPLNA